MTSKKVNITERPYQVYNDVNTKYNGYNLLHSITVMEKHITNYR